MFNMKIINLTSALHYRFSKDELRILTKFRAFLVGTFCPGDLHARTEKLLKRRGIAKAQRYFWEFKDRISQSVKQVRACGCPFGFGYLYTGAASVMRKCDC